MIAENYKILNPQRTTLTYADACDLAYEATTDGSSGKYCINCNAVAEITSSALARLILLRVSLLKRQSDLCLIILDSTATRNPKRVRP